MDKKLRDEDARAVDMLLDRGGSSGDVPMQVFTHAPEMFHNRLQNVEKLLRVLDEMPTLEPSPNLVARTLDLIEETEQRVQPTPTSARPSTQRPTA